MKKEAQIKRLLKELELELDKIRTTAWAIEDQVNEIRKTIDSDFTKKDVKRQNFKANFKYYFPLIVLFSIIVWPILVGAILKITGN